MSTKPLKKSVIQHIKIMGETPRLQMGRGRDSGVREVHGLGPPFTFGTGHPKTLIRHWLLQEYQPIYRLQNSL